ncbi:hypothetical protein BAGA_10325, partial [Bacillus gaemokensis]
RAGRARPAAAAPPPFRRVGRTAPSPCSGSSCPPQAPPFKGLAQTVGGQHHQDDHAARHGGQPPGAHQVIAPFGHQRAPLGRGRRGAEAQEAQRRYREDGGAQFQARQHQHGAGGVGHDVAAQHREPALAAAEGRLDIGVRLDPQHFGPHQPRKRGDGGHAGGQRHVDGAEAQHGDHHQRQQQRRDR